MARVYPSNPLTELQVYQSLEYLSAGTRLIVAQLITNNRAAGLIHVPSLVPLLLWECIHNRLHWLAFDGGERVATLLLLQSYGENVSKLVWCWNRDGRVQPIELDIAMMTSYDAVKFYGGAQFTNAHLIRAGLEARVKTSSFSEKAINLQRVNDENSEAVTASAGSTYKAEKAGV